MSSVSLELERLSAADIPSNVALSASVGWKDVASEWRVLHEAALVLGVRQGVALGSSAPGDARLIAQGALGDYGSAATLAKLVVAPELQRSGIGARLLDGLLAEAEARALPVGLCATPSGRRLYDSRGFEVVGELVVMTGTVNPGTARPGDVVSFADAASVIALDRQLLGCDRGRMLQARSREASARFALPNGTGYALASRQGEGWLVGPIVAPNEAAARLLASAIFASWSGPLRVDVPVEQQGFRAWLASVGLRELGVRAEMARGRDRLPWQVSQRFALATQAWS